MLVMLACAALFTACGNKPDKGASQVAAQVNGGEISVHQINFALQQQRVPVAPEQLDQVGRTLLERLIDQELAVQKAIDLKLDREPRVVQALEAARRNILAQTYLEQQAEAVPKPAAPEVDAYYAAKPSLFKDRRVYTFQEFVIQLPAQATPQVQSMLQASKSPQAFGDALKSAGLSFNVANVTRPAENLPLDLVDKVAAMSPGQALMLPEPNGVRALILVSSVAAPVSLDEAKPAIGQFLLGQSRRAATEAEMKALRSSASIKYIGQFAQAPASAPASAAQAAPAPVASASASVPGALDAEALGRGIKGLK